MHHAFLATVLRAGILWTCTLWANVGRASVGRASVLSLCICALGALSAAAVELELEDHAYFPGAGTRVLRIASTGDLEVFEPYLRAFQIAEPTISIDYSVISSAEMHRAIRDGVPFDLAISSAMDLQFQLANDGYAQSYRSARTQALPDWARWRDLIFAFTAEPAVVVYSTEKLAGLTVPATRQELITLLRDHPDRFNSMVGTYDVRESGLGYLFATQENRSTDAYWRLSEVMGRLDPKLYCCSGQMIDDVAEGRLALAYNVLGSYAAERLARESQGRIQLLRMQDFANVILRTALIPASATEVAAAGALIDMLAVQGLREAAGDWPLPPLTPSDNGDTMGFGPIRLGPALLVYLDPLNRRAFYAEWENAMEQR